jgi:hypothetical protein
VTIGIGFLTADGVTLCADRQLTNQVGGFKFEERKIFSFIDESWSIVFGYAGDPDGARIMFRKVSDGLNDEMSKSKLRGNVHKTRAALERLFRDRNATNVQSLIGIRYNNNGTCYLFKTSGHKVLDGAEQYIGVGDSSLLRYLCDLIPQHPANTHEAEVIGCYLISVANRYVDGCSGGPDVASIRQADGFIGENLGRPFPKLKQKFLHCEEVIGKELRELLLSGGYGYVRKIRLSASQKSVR